MRSFYFDSFHAVQLWLRHFADSPFLAGLVAVCLFSSCFLLAWMRTAILAGGIAVVRSGFVVRLRVLLRLIFFWRLGYRPCSAWSPPKKIGGSRKI